jgi:hypothetical protein
MTSGLIRGMTSYEWDIVVEFIISMHLKFGIREVTFGWNGFIKGRLPYVNYTFSN